MSTFDPYSEPDPSGSPLEKLKIARRTPSPKDFARYLMREGIEPDLAQRIGRAVQEWDKEMHYDEVEQLINMEMWANSHTHPGGSGGGGFAGDGTVVSSFTTPGTNPTALCFDGTNLRHGDMGNWTIYELTTTGTVLSSFLAPGGNSNNRPYGLTFDGSFLWLMMNYSVSDTLHKLNPDGSTVSNSTPPSLSPAGLANDGTYLWYVDYGDDTIRKLDLSTLSVVTSFTTPTTDPWGLTYDGEQLWVSDYVANTIYALDPDTGAGGVSFASPAATPRDMAWDGNNLYVACRGDNKIYQLG